MVLIPAFMSLPPPYWSSVITSFRRQCATERSFHRGNSRTTFGLSCIRVGWPLMFHYMPNKLQSRGLEDDYSELKHGLPCEFINKHTLPILCEHLCCFQCRFLAYIYFWKYINIPLRRISETTVIIVELQVLAAFERENILLYGVWRAPEGSVSINVAHIVPIIPFEECLATDFLLGTCTNSHLSSGGVYCFFRSKIAPLFIR